MLDNNATRDSLLENAFTLLGLQIKSNFTRTLTIDAAAPSIKDGTGNGEGFLLAGGTLKLTNDSYLTLNNLEGKAVWSGGDFSSEGDEDTKLYVYNSTTFTIQEDAQKLGVTLVIGENSGGTPGAATVDVGLFDGQVGLAGNLTLYKNADIHIKQAGILNLNQKIGSATKGGITYDAASTNSYIRVWGKLVRTRPDLNDQTIQVQPKVSDELTSTEIRVVKNAKVHWQDGVDLQLGKLVQETGSKSQGQIRTLTGQPGKVVIEGTGEAPGHKQIYFDGNLELLGGGVEFIGPAGVFFTVNVTGDLDIGEDATVSLRVDGGVDESSDGFAVEGVTTINGAALVVTTDAGSPEIGNTYTFITSTGGFSGTGWASPIAHDGYAAAYVLDNPGKLRAIGATITGVTWNDADRDGIRDGGESFRSGVTVYLLDAGWNVIDSVETDGNGRYTFTDVAPGTYYIQFEWPHDSYYLTSNDAGSDDSIDSDADPYSGQTQALYAVFGQVLEDVDAGYRDTPVWG